MSQRHVVVIGGGLAGITAAISLRDAGVAVTMLESRPRLGGAASSYARAGMMIDNGQHVFLRCCTSYQALLARLGVTGQVAIQDRFDVTVLSGAPGARPARLRRNGLPSPLHLAGALAGYPLLSLAERARVGRAALAFRFADPASPALDRQRLGDWLAARGQDERARRRLWDLFIISALNIGGDDANVGLAATVIKTALLGRRDAADIGMAKVPLGRPARGRHLGSAGTARRRGQARSQGRGHRVTGRRLPHRAEPRRRRFRRARVGGVGRDRGDRRPVDPGGRRRASRPVRPGRPPCGHGGGDRPRPPGSSSVPRRS